MSSDDDSPRKTLSLTKKPRATSAADRHDALSKRSGARARAVALAARQNPEREQARDDSRGPARRDGPRTSEGLLMGDKPPRGNDSRSSARPSGERHVDKQGATGAHSGPPRGPGRQPGKPRPATDRSRYTGLARNASIRQPERAPDIVTEDTERRLSPRCGTRCE